MKLKSPQLRRYIAEGILIIFSVLFALFINKLFSDYQTAQKKDIALRSIIRELKANEECLIKWKEKHTKIKERLSLVIEGRNDSLKNELLSYNYFNFSPLSDDEPIINEMLSTTSWETAKITGIIAEFDYKTIEKLTSVYELQHHLSKVTLIKILDFFLEVDAHSVEKLDITIKQFDLLFHELVGQEILMTELYGKAIHELEK